MWKRNCPNCNKEIKYKTKKLMRFGERHNTYCRPCSAKNYDRMILSTKETNCKECGRKIKYKNEKNIKLCELCRKNRKIRKKRDIGVWTRICPNSDCGKEMPYVNRRSYNLAKNKNSLCQKCATNTEEHKERTANIWKGKTRPIFSDEWRKNLGKSSKGRKFDDETILKRIATRVGLTVENYLKSLPDYEKYKRKVRRITNQQPLHILPNIEKRGRTTYHLDHIISVAEGFRKNILPGIVGNIENLQMLPAKENLIKSDKTSIRHNG